MYFFSRPNIYNHGYKYNALLLQPYFIASATKYGYVYLKNV